MISVVLIGGSHAGRHYVELGTPTLVFPIKPKHIRFLKKDEPLLENATIETEEYKHCRIYLPPTVFNFYKLQSLSDAEAMQILLDCYGNTEESG